MKLVEVAQVEQEDPLAKAQRELRELISKAGYYGQGAIAPQYHAQYERLKNVIITLKNERKAAKQAEFAQAASREFERDLVQRRSKETPEQLRSRRADNIRAGLAAARAYRDGETRDYTTLAQKVHDIVVKASNHGAQKVTTEVIAQHFPDVTPRIIDKWLERPEFRRTRQLMGRD